MKLLDYNSLSTPKRRVVNSLYAAAHGGDNLIAFTARGQSITSLVADGWLIYEYGHALKLTQEGMRAVEAHRSAKKVTADTRSKMERIADMARRAKERAS